MACAARLLENLERKTVSRLDALTEPSVTAMRSIAEATYYEFTRRHLLEGRYQQGRRRYHNWDSSYARDPKEFYTPTSEGELRDIVTDSEHIGMVGGGHSFNDLNLRRNTLVSLDAYRGLVETDGAHVTVRAGTRMRDLSRALHHSGLALPVLPDHNVQSLGGILAHDVHASGAIGYISRAVTKLRLLDGLGDVHDLRPADPLFKATIGGMGATGIILEATLECCPAFQLRTRAFRCSLQDLLAHIGDWTQQFDLLAAGYFAAADECVVEVKTTTDAPPTPFAEIIETSRHVAEAIGQAVALPLSTQPNPIGFAGRVGLRAMTASLDLRPPLTLRSLDGFGRNVFQIHKEVEFACPAHRFREVFERGVALLHERPRQHYYLLGVRRTPGNPATLVGPGAGAPDDQLVWIAPHLYGNVIEPVDEAAWRAVVESVDGRPHYGKNLLGLGSAYFAHIHGERWQKFLDLVEQVDPKGRFRNPILYRS